MKKQIASLLSVTLLCWVLAGTPVFAQKTSSIIKAHGISIAYEIFGPAHAETILLIQGTGAQLTGWPQELCEQLAKAGYRVVRFDNRDAGLSSSLDSLGAPDWAAILPHVGSCDSVSLPYTLMDMAKDAIGLLDALNISKAHIVGASMGGAIAQLIAIHFPERVLSLTSIMASTGNPQLPQGNPETMPAMSTPPPQTEDAEERARYLFNIYKALDSPAYPVADSALLQTARNDVNRAWKPAGTARQVAAIVIADHCDRRQQLSQLKMPVAIIHGEADPLVNIAAAKELAATIPHSSLITLAGMGHNLPAALIPTVCNAILLNVKKAEQH